MVDNGDDTQILEQIHNLNQGLNDVILAKVPQLAESISNSKNPNQATIDAIVERLLDKMTKTTMQKFEKYGVGVDESSIDLGVQNMSSNLEDQAPQKPTVAPNSGMQMNNIGAGSTAMPTQQNMMGMNAPQPSSLAPDNNSQIGSSLAPSQQNPPMGGGFGGSSAMASSMNMQQPPSQGIDFYGGGGGGGGMPSQGPPSGGFGNSSMTESIQIPAQQNNFMIGQDQPKPVDDGLLSKLPKRPDGNPKCLSPEYAFRESIASIKKLHSKKLYQQVMSNNQSTIKLAVNNGVQIIIEKCDVVKEYANVLVNTANSHLYHDGGLAKVFVQNAGNSILLESQTWLEKFDRVPVGGLAVTSAGDLQNAQNIIHAVGPNWNEHKNEEKLMVQCLKCCIFNILDTSSHMGAQTLALPSISTGTYGFPAELNGYITIQCVLDWCMACDIKQLKSIKLCNFDANTHEAFMRAFNTLHMKYQAM